MPIYITITANQNRLKPGGKIYSHIYIYIYIYIYYDEKRESMKDYKYFFYQYSEFHVFTRQSLAV